MKFHTFGEPTSPVMLLIHGMLTPWQIWDDQIKAFCESYYVIVPELDSHTEDEPSSFVSIEEEAEKIEDWLIDHDITSVSVVCGLSLGGAIAYEMWHNGVIGIDRLVLDGAPLMPMPAIAGKMMTNSYMNIIRKSVQRDPKTFELFKRDFLPEKFWEDFLKIANNMDEQSVKSIMQGVCSRHIYEGVENNSRILFLHGTKGNEIVSKKAAAKLKKLYPDTEVICYKGDPHAYKVVRETDVWIRDVKAFLDRT